MSTVQQICIYGAGSIGCYIGGRLLAGGAAVRFLGRARIGREVLAHGLQLSDLRGDYHRITPDKIDWSEESIRALREADWVLVAVKSADTVAAASDIAAHAPAHAAVLSLQNGLHNAEVLAAALPGRLVLSGMVPFNVLNRGKGAFHQGSNGELRAERHPRIESLLPMFAAAGLPLQLCDDMPGVQWAKLLLNLNNAVNALSGLPLKAQLSQRAYRRCVALAQREALRLMSEAGIKPAHILPVPLRWLPTLMSLPDALFRRAAASVLAIDPLARSSMWEDLEAGRITEVEWLNGEIVRLAEGLHRHAPINQHLINLIRQAEAGIRSDWSGESLLMELKTRNVPLR